jgi:chromosome segregation ATPase
MPENTVKSDNNRLSPDASLSQGPTPLSQGEPSDKTLLPTEEQVASLEMHLRLRLCAEDNPDETIDAKTLLKYVLAASFYLASRSVTAISALEKERDELEDELKSTIWMLEQDREQLAKAVTEVERLTRENQVLRTGGVNLDEQNEALRSEVERLKGEIDLWISRASETIIQADAVHKREQGYLSELSDYAREMPALRAENAKLRAENGLLMAENRTESERLKEACDGYLGHAAGLRDENAKLIERIRFADQEFAAECAGLRGEIERLTDTGSRFAQANAALQDANEDLRSEVHELRAENERLREALEPFARDTAKDVIWVAKAVQKARAALSRTSEET